MPAAYDEVRDRAVHRGQHWKLKPVVNAAVKDSIPVVAVLNQF